MRNAAFLILVLVALHVRLGVFAQAAPEDGFLRGYITAVLERQLGWARGTYDLRVEGGRATITLPQADPERRARAETALAGTEGLSSLSVTWPASSAVQGSPASAQATGRKAFPRGDLFSPLLADVKEPRFFVSLRQFKTFGQTISRDFDRFTMASVAYGGTFGLARWPGRTSSEGLQLSLDGALFAQFNMNSPSHDLLNADYTVGIPVTYRRGGFSLRFRLYHQSSHLGDEFLLRYHPTRVNLSFESFQLILSGESRHWRVYGGGEYYVDQYPHDLRPGGLQGGVEYRSVDPLFGTAKFVAGLDVKSFQENSWNPSYSLKAGFAFGAGWPDRPGLRLMAEAYHGFSPYGQYYTQRVQYVGMGLYFDF